MAFAGHLHRPVTLKKLNAFKTFDAQIKLLGYKFSFRFEDFTEATPLFV